MFAVQRLHPGSHGKLLYNLKAGPLSWLTFCRCDAKLIVLAVQRLHPGSHGKLLYNLKVRGRIWLMGDDWQHFV